MTPNGDRSRAVNFGDVIAVLFYVGTCSDCPPNANGVDYDSIKGSCDWDANTVPDKEGLCYDRSPGPEPNPPGDAGPPSGAIALTDVLAVLAQFGLDCSEQPGLSLFIEAPSEVSLWGADFEAVTVDQHGQPVAGHSVQCSLSPTGGALALLSETGVTGPDGRATFTLVPTGASCVAGEELTITCFLSSDPNVRATEVVPVDCSTTVTWINPPSHTRPLGFIVEEVVIEEVPELGAYEWMLSYDPAVISFVDVADGGFLGSTGRIVDCSPILDVGSIRFGCVTTGSQAGPSGSGVLSVITFFGFAEGTSPLNLTDVDLTDPLGMEQYSSRIEDGSVTVSNQPTPPPTLVASQAAPTQATATPVPGGASPRD
jgi:hypothetical protein